FLRSCPFFQSSCPIMNDTLPALREKPTILSSSFQVSSTLNPRTSRYHPRLFSRSFTVKLGDADFNASDSDPRLDFAAALAARAGAFLFARLVVFLGFFAAISSSKKSDAMTAAAPSQDSARGQVESRLAVASLWCSSAPKGQKWSYRQGQDSGIRKTPPDRAGG